MIQRREIENVTSSQGSSGGARNSQIRLGKRTREDPVMFASPLAKRQRGWYKMIRGRRPIGRMQNSRAITSPRVSAEKQVFSQGSLMVGDMVLPLPARAQSE